jgi:threonine dehydratase
MAMRGLPDFDDVRRAARRIEPYVHRTPVLTCSALDRMVGAELYFKCENFQKVGAFKFRGACNAVFSFSDQEVSRGVGTHSSGNHAAALALAARLRGVPAYIVMPANASEVKKAAVAGFGARIFPCEPSEAGRGETMAKVLKETGAVFVHPSDDPLVIAGQGTATVELLEEVPGLDVILAPVGGGGLLSGTALAANGLSPQTRVLGAEPEGADDAYRSLQEGRIVPSVDPRTVADGLLTSLGENTFPIIREHVEQIVTVSEEAIVAGMRHVWERMKIVIEASAAVPVGALLEGKIDLSGLRVGVILSGGNVDLDKLPWLSS